MSAGIGWLDTEFDPFPDARRSGGTEVDLSDFSLPGAPRWTWNARVDYRRALPARALEAFLSMELFGCSETRSNIEGVAGQTLGLPSFPYVVPSREVANLRLGRAAPRWRISVFVENVFDKIYHTSINDNFGLSGMGIRPHPRTLGLRVSYHFGTAP